MLAELPREESQQIQTRGLFCLFGEIRLAWLLWNLFGEAAIATTLNQCFGIGETLRDLTPVGLVFDNKIRRLQTSV